MSAGRPVEAALPRGWLLKTELLLIDSDNKPVKSLWDSFFSVCQAYRDWGEEGTPDDWSNKACLKGFLCMSSSAASIAWNESMGLNMLDLSITSHKGIPRQELSLCCLKLLGAAFPNHAYMPREAALIWGLFSMSFSACICFQLRPNPWHKMDKYLFALDPMAGVFRPKRWQTCKFVFWNTKTFTEQIQLLILNRIFLNKVVIMSHLLAFYCRSYIGEKCL